MKRAKGIKMCLIQVHRTQVEKQTCPCCKSVRYVTGGDVRYKNRMNTSLSKPTFETLQCMEDTLV